MQAPIPPSLKEFGLTEVAVATIHRPGFRRNPMSGKVVWAALIVLEILSLVYFHPKSVLDFMAVLLGTPLVGLFLVIFLVMFFGIILSLIAAILEPVWNRLRGFLNEDFKKSLAYKAALADYSRKKLEFDTWVRKKHEEYWRSLSGIEFENELGKLFSLMGYNVQLTPKTGDGGVDILLRKSGRLIVVQCKAHNKRIPIGVARELSASMADFHTNEAIIACFEGVTKPVDEYIKDKRITVLKLADIIGLQRQHG